MKGRARRGEDRVGTRATLQLLAFGAAFTTVLALVLALALPLWLLFRLPGAVVTPGGWD